MLEKCVSEFNLRTSTRHASETDDGELKPMQPQALDGRDCQIGVTSAVINHDRGLVPVWGPLSGPEYGQETVSPTVGGHRYLSRNRAGRRHLF